MKIINIITSRLYANISGNIKFLEKKKECSILSNNVRVLEKLQEERCMLNTI